MSPMDWADAIALELPITVYQAVRQRIDTERAKLAAAKAENAELTLRAEQAEAENVRKQRTNLELVELTKDLENQRDEARAVLQELWNRHNANQYIGARLTKLVEDALSTSREPSPPPQKPATCVCGAPLEEMTVLATRYRPEDHKLMVCRACGDEPEDCNCPSPPPEPEEAM